jgi:hypothetical protein
VRAAIVFEELKTTERAEHRAAGMLCLFLYFHTSRDTAPQLAVSLGRERGPVRLGRREFIWINVTANPTAEWVERRITEAFPWNEAPRYMIRDRDRIYGTVVTRRLRAMGGRDKPIAPASPWQNGFAERLIGNRLEIGT